jgi:LacI family transcriptional regulator
MFVGEESQPDLSALVRGIGLPTVIVERNAPNWIDSVRVDHVEATKGAIVYLLSMGHKDVALLTAACSVRTTSQRIAGVHRALADAAVAKDRAFISTECSSNAMSYAVTTELMARQTPPTAIVVIASGLAGTLRALKALGRQVPEDISVLCLGDTELSTLIAPNTTSVLWDHPEVGRPAVELLLQRLSGRTEGNGRHLLLPCNLVLRNSCAPPADKRR